MTHSHSTVSTRRVFRRRVSYSGVYLELKEVKAYTPEPEQRISYGEELLGALRDGFEAVGDFFRGFLLVLASSLPLLVILGLLVFLLVKLVRKLLRRRKARKEAKRAKMAAAAKSDQAEDKDESIE